MNKNAAFDPGLSKSNARLSPLPVLHGERVRVRGGGASDAGKVRLLKIAPRQVRRCFAKRRSGPIVSLKLAYW